MEFSYFLPVTVLPDNHHKPDLRKFCHLQTPVPCQQMHLPALC